MSQAKDRLFKPIKAEPERPFAERLAEAKKEHEAKRKTPAPKAEAKAQPKAESKTPAPTPRPAAPAPKQPIRAIPAKIPAPVKK